METQDDFKELLSLFNAHKVEYCITGGYALAFHGAPRMTGDIDLLVNPTHKNAERILSALQAFGFGSLGLTAEDLTTPDYVIQLGHPPVRIDLLTSITGVGWEEADSGKVQSHYGDVPVYFIGRDQLIANKRAVNRKRDQADLEALGES